MWQRWRMLNAAPARFLDLTITQMNGVPAPCEIALLAKDGLYLLQMPRMVQNMMIVAAGR